MTQLFAVCIAWADVSNATSYNVYRNGVLIGNSEAAFFVDTTAEENQEYTYGVSAVGDGGESAQATITVYTRSGYFQYKPLIKSANFQ